VATEYTEGREHPLIGFALTKASSRNVKIDEVVVSVRFRRGFSVFRGHGSRDASHRGKQVLRSLRSHQDDRASHPFASEGPAL